MPGTTKTSAATGAAARARSRLTTSTPLVVDARDARAGILRRPCESLTPALNRQRAGREPEGLTAAGGSPTMRKMRRRLLRGALLLVLACAPFVASGAGVAGSAEV